MADISKCSGKDCPLKEQCYRYTAPDSKWQLRLVIVPYKKETNTCEMFYNNEKRKHGKS